MSFNLKRIFSSILFNSSLFLILLIGIQNSSSKYKVKFFKNKTVDLPLSFIIGASFISGSITGSLINIKQNDIPKKNS